MRVMALAWRVLSLALVFPVGIASAAPDGEGSASGPSAAADLERAREDYQAAMQLEAAGNWSAALAKLRAVARVAITPRVHFHLGLCQEKLGRWTEALGAYRMAVAGAQAKGDPDAVREADEARRRLEEKVPRLTVARGEGAATRAATVALDGIGLGEAAIGRPQWLDPGSHKVEAFLDGSRRFVEVVDLAPGEARTVTVRLAPAPSVASVAAGSERASPSRAVPIVILGAGALSLAAGGVFWGLRQGTIDDLEARCAGYHCPEGLEGIRDRGVAFTAASVGSFVAGGLATGVAVLLLARGRRSPAVSVSAVGLGGASLRGAF
jgi:hypothetical protein